MQNIIKNDLSGTHLATFSNYLADKDLKSVLMNETTGVEIRRKKVSAS